MNIKKEKERILKRIGTKKWLIRSMTFEVPFDVELEYVDDRLHHGGWLIFFIPELKKTAQIFLADLFPENSVQLYNHILNKEIDKLYYGH